MKILIISGFLGAGKTTFIRELVRRTGQNIAILENEYAAEGIDGALLSDTLSSNKKLNIWEMTEGCICCSTKGDFAASVLTIANTIDPAYLIVEPTGVGMLSNVIANLQQIEYDRIILLSPITIVDGKSFSFYTGADRQDQGKAVFIGNSISRAELLLRFSFDDITLNRRKKH